MTREALGTPEGFAFWRVSLTVDERQRGVLKEFADFLRDREIVAPRQSSGGQGVPLEHFKENVFFLPFGTQREGLMIYLNGVVQTEGHDYHIAVLAHEVVAVVMEGKLRENDNLLATFQV